MKIIDFLTKNEKPFFSVEITPPLKSKSIKQIFKVLDKLIPYNLSFVNVTYHQEVIERKTINGVDRKIIYQKHASTVGVCSAIKFKYGIEVVPHFICGGFNKFEIENALYDLSFLGIENILVLRGDPRKNEVKFSPKENGHQHASELVKQIKGIENHILINDFHSKTDINWCVGVAGYPEIHNEALSLETDIRWLKYKVDKGADFIVTQMFYDYDRFIDWVKKCRLAGISVPIIPGLKPLTKKKQIRRFEKNFGIKIPEKFKNRMGKAINSEEAYNIGIDFMTELSIRLIKFGSPGIHYFTMGNGNDVKNVVERIF